ncbi:hypothetical protein GCM10012280_05170 [Wenjunlia tyrosinilytica]|uniref:Sirohydrochlorin cobaltochelatase n=1 Tax=Wenjunlia tyrosinilytica TaxID=1544741 RepID=A0A917ZEY8_9ACTN|nr:hypothetical protein GCM10012280_05170 [Wenjunlia tyrosinilytica]
MNPPAPLSALERRIDAALGATQDAEAPHRDASGSFAPGSARRSPGDRAATTVLLVGRGSTDPEANAELCRVARLLWEGRGLAGVETAFVSVAAPDVPAGLDRCHLLGARRVVLVPFLLADEALSRRARLQAEGWAEAHPEVELRFAAAVGPEEDEDEGAADDPDGPDGPDGMDSRARAR